MSKSNYEIYQVSRNKKVNEQALDVILKFNTGVESILLRGFGDEISKTIDLVNVLKDRLGEGIIVETISTGTVKKGEIHPRPVSYIEVLIRKKY
ncbi:DNA-binding protein [Sulfolobales archaeon HS-7]|nr:DNA-binding protein [Sulfolobales archaeon HS-7]